jgi:hypothetical protein
VGLNKVAHDISKTSEKAGRDIKAETKRASSKAHNELTDAGNATKKTLKKATGIKAPQFASAGRSEQGRARHQQDVEEGRQRHEGRGQAREGQGAWHQHGRPARA